MDKRSIDPVAAPAPPAERPGAYAWYVAFLLMFINVLGFVDRRFPLILMEDIKRDLALSDTQVGLLAGMMFFVVYALAGIPLGGMSDRGSRKHVLGWAVAAWSTLTAVGGFAANFWQLALSRMGVAAGEAACYPAAQSVIADYFRPAFRARAMGVFLMGSQIGALLGLAIGGSTRRRTGEWPWSCLARRVSSSP